MEQSPDDISWGLPPTLRDDLRRRAMLLNLRLLVIQTITFAIAGPLAMAFARWQSLPIEWFPLTLAVLGFIALPWPFILLAWLAQKWLDRKAAPSGVVFRVTPDGLHWPVVRTRDQPVVPWEAILSVKVIPVRHLPQYRVIKIRLRRRLRGIVLPGDERDDAILRVFEHHLGNRLTL